MSPIFPQLMKFCVSDPVHSECIQKAAIKKGAFWPVGGYTVQFTGARYIFIGTDGMMLYGSVTSAYDVWPAKEYDVDCDGNLCPIDNKDKQ